MSQIFIKKIVLWAFRSFVDRTTFDFSDTGLVLINGKNLDTGGSSGAGKTSLILALAYAFDYCPFPATELQSWLTDKAMGVEVTLNTPEGVVVLTRGSKTSLKVGSDKPITTVTAVTKKLKEIIGLDKDLLEPLTYRAQNEPGAFLRRRNAEKLKFLTDITGMVKFEEEVKTVTEKIKGLEATSRLEQDRLEQEEKVLKQLTDSPPTVHSVDVETPCQRLVECEGAIKQKSLNVFETKAALSLEDNNEKLIVQEIQNSFQIQLNSLQAEADKFKGASYTEDRSELVALEGAKGQLQSVWFELEKIDLVKKSEINSQVATIDKIIRNARDSLATIPAMIRTRDNTQRDLNSLLAQDPTCPTCLRSWKGEALEAKIKKFQNNMGEINESIQTAENNRPVLEKAESERATLVFIPNSLIEKYKGQYQELLQIKSGIEGKLKNQRQVHGLEIEGNLKTLRMKWKDVERERDLKIQAIITDPQSKKNNFQSLFNSLEAELKNLEFQRLSLTREVSLVQQQQKDVERILRDYQVSLTRLRTDLEGQRGKTAAATTALNAEKDYLELIKTWMQAFVEECLTSISDETNRILASVPNVAHCSISFSTQTTSEKGVVRNEISPLVMVGGHEASLRSGLSGGMLTAVDLAVDIAVSKIVSERTGKFPGWILLDEPFNGLGLTEKEAALEVLKQYASDRLVFVIDHSAQFKSFFTQQININLKDGKTYKETENG